MLGKLNRYLAKVSVFLIVAVLIAAIAGCGDGGGYNPPPSQNLEIRTWYDLDAVRNNLAGNHTLMNDLDSTTLGYEELAGPTANGGKGWEPMGNASVAYAVGCGGPGGGVGVSSLFLAGTFDGQEYEIRDLFINRPDEGDVGLFFGVGQDGVIKNIGVVNATVTGATVTGVANVGSLVGWNSGTVSNSYSTGSVSGNDHVGGLIGGNGGTVSSSYSTCNVTGNSLVGGLVGMNTGTVDSSYSTGNVSGNDCVGGLVGQNWYGIVSNSYSTANVTGYSNVGGLVGSNAGSTVSNSYSSGNVTGNVTIGGLVGEDWHGTGNVSNSFWDIQTSGQATSDGGTGKNTTEMQDINTFSDAGWNIIAVALNETNPAYIWNIVDNVTYPFLSWQSV
jgi:hypothetical protein